MSSAKWPPFCLGGDKLNTQILVISGSRSWAPHPLISGSRSWAPHPLISGSRSWAPHPLISGSRSWAPHPLISGSRSWAPHPLISGSRSWAPHPLTAGYVKSLRDTTWHVDEGTRSELHFETIFFFYTHGVMLKYSMFIVSACEVATDTHSFSSDKFTQIYCLNW